MTIYSVVLPPFLPAMNQLNSKTQVFVSHSEIIIFHIHHSIFSTLQD